MSIANDLNDVIEASGYMLARLAIFADHIPDEWLRAAATLSEKATIRRRLPSDMVLWLVVGMAFFRNEPISEVARRLNICAEGLANDALLADSALSQARQRLGKQPLEWLFKQCADVWGGNVILKTIGTVYRSLPSMGPCSGPRICLSSERISARVTPQPTGRHPTRCCGWSR